MLLGVLYAVPVRNVEGGIVISNVSHIASQGLLNLSYAIKA